MKTSSDRNSIYDSVLLNNKVTFDVKMSYIQLKLVWFLDNLSLFPDVQLEIHTLFTYLILLIPLGCGFSYPYQNRSTKKKDDR